MTVVVRGATDRSDSHGCLVWWCRYEGFYAENVKAGQGKFWYPDGSIYDGRPPTRRSSPLFPLLAAHTCNQSSIILTRAHRSCPPSRELGCGYPGRHGKVSGVAWSPLSPGCVCVCVAVPFSSGEVK